MLMERLKTKHGSKKIMICSSDETGCGNFRSNYPYLVLKQNFIDSFFSYGFPREHPYLYETDILMVQRAAHETFPELFTKLREMGKKIIYDLDDTLWHIPASNLSHRHYGSKQLKAVENVVNACDCITTSTIPLKEFMESKFPTKKVFLLPNHVWHNELDEKPKNDKIKIGWAGSYTHAGDFDHYLVDVIRKLPKDKVEFYTMGYNPQFFKSLSEYTPWVSFKDYHKTLYDMNWDIGIIVAENNMFNKCKSSIKYYEYSLAKCASIASNTYPYVNTIEHGVDGFIVENKKKDWKEYINTLVEDEKFRLEVANRAYDKVKYNYTWEYQKEQIENRYLEIFDYLYSN